MSLPLLSRSIYEKQHLYEERLQHSPPLACLQLSSFSFALTHQLQKE